MNVLFGKVVVLFMYMIKVMELFFLVLFSALFLGDIFSFVVVGAFVLVVGGVVFVFMMEVSFCWVGFLVVMGLNIMF